MEEFHFAKPGRKSPFGRRASSRAVKLRDEAETGPFFIRGEKAGSKDEYWVSLFLEWLTKNHGINWEYQYSVYGGRRIRGGNVIDFLVYTPGRWTVLDPMGRVWHSGHREDRYQMENVCRKRNWKLIAWYTDQTPSKEAVFAFLKKEFYV